LTTTRQVASNRRNARRSTGPRTPAGKARSAHNALIHGLRSTTPVLPCEKVQDWDNHLQGIVQSLAPTGALEAELANRVAQILWRLRRVTAYETGLIALRLMELETAVEEPRTRPTSPGLDTAALPATPLEAARQEKVRRHRTLALWEGPLQLLRRLPTLPDTTPLAGEVVYAALEDLRAAVPPDADGNFDIEDAGFLERVGIPSGSREGPWDWSRMLSWTGSCAMRRTCPGRCCRPGIRWSGCKRGGLGNPFQHQLLWTAPSRVKPTHPRPSPHKLGSFGNFSSSAAVALSRVSGTMRRLRFDNNGQRLPVMGKKDQPPNLAEQLCQAIQRSGLSLNQLAKGSGVHKGQLSRFLRGERTLTLRAAARISAFLGLRLTGPVLDSNK
jgi:hypothetical protein